MEIALEESEALYKTVVNNTLNIILISVNKIIEFTNDAASDFIGIPQEDIIGRNIDELYKSTNSGIEGTSLAEKIKESINNNHAVEVQLQEKDSDTISYFLVRSNTIQYKGKEAVMSIFIDVTENKNIEKYVLKRVIETEENDRKKFAADLHDDLGPILSTIKLRLDLMSNMHPETDELKENISISAELIGLVVEKIRTISHNITPHLIDTLGLDAGVRDLCKKIKELNKVDIEYESDIQSRRFSQSVELHFYRIISELINNSLKHSQGQVINLILSCQENKLELTYTDNGIGYNYSESMQKAGGIGLRNILNRVTLINAIIKFQIIEGKTIVKIIKRIEPASIKIN
jgi:PAS domain S-box-containing protein